MSKGFADRTAACSTGDSPAAAQLLEGSGCWHKDPPAGRQACRGKEGIRRLAKKRCPGVVPAALGVWTSLRPPSVGSGPVLPRLREDAAAWEAARAGKALSAPERTPPGWERHRRFLPWHAAPRRPLQHSCGRPADGFPRLCAPGGAREETGAGGCCRAPKPRSPAFEGWRQEPQQQGTARERDL